MNNPPNHKKHISQTEKNPFALTNKKQTTNPETIVHPTNPTSLSGWIQLYYLLVVKAQANKTQIAKQQDLKKFLTFYREFTKSDNIKYWISPITKEFQKHLQQQLSPTSNKPYKATSINRILATIKHFATWLVSRHPLPDGNPTQSTKEIIIDEPTWKGLTSQEVKALEQACQDRLNHQESNRQNPRLEVAVFYCLLYTGLRESELINLNRNQYYNDGFHQVRRKNNRVTEHIPLPPQVTYVLDNYISVNNLEETGPLLISKRKSRIAVRSLGYICERLAKQAYQYLDTNHKFHVTPHQLRHTFLKKITDKHGIHYAQKMSGNSSIKEIFRYAKPSQAEIKECVNTLFDDVL